MLIKCSLSVDLVLWNLLSFIMFILFLFTWTVPVLSELNQRDSILSLSLSASCAAVANEPFAPQGEAPGEEELSDKEDEEEEEEEMEEEEDGEETDEEEWGETFEDCVEEEDWQTCSEGEEEETGSSSTASFHNSSRLLSKDQLLELFKTVHSGTKLKEGQITVGAGQWNVSLHLSKATHNKVTRTATERRLNGGKIHTMHQMATAVGSNHVPRRAESYAGFHSNQSPHQLMSLSNTPSTREEGTN